jgi:hypothetical protein
MYIISPHSQKQNIIGNFLIIYKYEYYVGKCKLKILSLHYFI